MTDWRNRFLNVKDKRATWDRPGSDLAILTEISISTFHFPCSRSRNGMGLGG